MTRTHSGRLGRGGIVVALAAALALTGCTQAGTRSGGPQGGTASGHATQEAATPAPAPITAQVLQTSSALAQGNPTVSYAGMNYSKDGTGLLAAYRSNGAGLSEAAFWRAANGQWSETKIPGIPEGNVIDLTLNGAMISGTVTSTEGKPTGFILRDGGSGTWTPIKVPASAAGYELTQQAWGDDDTAYLLGTDGLQRAVLLTQAGSGVSVHPLPDVGAGRSRTFRTLAAHGRTIVAGYYEGAVAGQPASLAYVSADGGATWRSVTVTTDTLSEYTSSTHDGDQFVIAGEGSKDGKNRPLIPMMWTSKDGLAWAPLPGPTVRAGDVRGPDDDDGDTYFAGQTAGTSLGAVGSSSSPGVSVFRKDPGTATWSKWGPTLDTSSIAPTATAFRLEKGYGVLTSGNGELSVWALAGKAWKKQFTAGKTSDAPSARRIYPGQGGITATGNQPSFAYTDDGGWWNSINTVAMELDGDRLVSASWPAVDFKNVQYAVIGTDPQGAQVMAGRRATGKNAEHIQTWTRAPGGAWRESGRVKVPGSTSPSAITWDGNRWVMLMSENVKKDSWRFAFRVSADAKTWTTLAADAPASYEAWSSALCPLPGGKLLAVGQTHTAAAGSYYPQAWVIEGDRATQVPEQVMKQTGASGFPGCAPGDDGVLLTDVYGEALYLTKDGTTFDKAVTLEPGTRGYYITAVPGGYAIGGRATTGTAIAPAIWLSKDAKTWQMAPLPGAYHAGAEVAVASDGTNLIAITVASQPVQAWRVADTASLLR